VESNHLAQVRFRGVVESVFEHGNETWVLEKIKNLTS
jgi:hypothetical protein